MDLYNSIWFAPGIGAFGDWVQDAEVIKSEAKAKEIRNLLIFFLYCSCKFRTFFYSLWFSVTSLWPSV
jgi:hypothetical protein